MDAFTVKGMKESVIPILQGALHGDHYPVNCFRKSATVKSALLEY